MAPDQHVNKKRKIKRSSFADYVGDSPYKSPRGRQNTPPETLSVKSSRKGSKPGVRRPKKRNARDPFDYFSDDVVGIVISLLPAHTTEVLRRVSKLWKASSEFHNASEAIRRHFCYLGEGNQVFTCREDANLYFRRLLYHQESLKLGYASRAFRFAGADLWHINGNVVCTAARSQDDKSICIRHLRSPANKAFATMESLLEINLQQLWPSFTLLDRLHVTKAGEVVAIMTGPVLSKATDSYQMYPTKLAKLSCTGTILWQEDLSCSGVSSTISDDTIYTIEADVDRPRQSSSKNSFYLMRRNLLDGTMIGDRYRIRVFEDDDYVLWRCRLSLTSNKKWLVCSPQNKIVYLFNVMRDLQIHRLITIHPSTVISSKINDVFWEINYQYSYSGSTRCIVSSSATSATDLTRSDRYFVHRYRHDTSGVGFDPDRNLFFRIMHSRPTPGNHTTTEDPLSTIEKSSLTDYPQGWLKEDRHAIVEEKASVTITLPDRTKPNPSARREILLTLPWSIRAGDFFGMADDYLVYHNKCDGILIVYDFWPDW